MPDASLVTVGVGGLCALAGHFVPAFVNGRNNAGKLALEIATTLKDEVATLRAELNTASTVISDLGHVAANLKGAVDGLLMAFDLPEDKRAPFIERAKAARNKAERKGVRHAEA